ncbi:MAG: glycoside hydrolase family 38 C-terminal domain-containing protein [Acidobacteriota bacterium]|nr:glycoside hydrolase family 38 C-terminal domain-containing protein [Acidobacteriota bacterium]
MLESDEHSGAGGWPGYFTPEEFDRNARQHLDFAREARDDAAALVDAGLARLVADLPVAGDAVVAVNTLGFERDGWVRQALPAAIYDTDFRVVERGSGREVVYQRFDDVREILFRAEAVPAAGYRVYDLLGGAPTAQPQGVLAVDSGSLENDFYRVEISSTDGSVTSFYDKVRGLELVDGAAAYRFNELAHNTHQDTTAGNPPVAQAPSAATVTVEENGPLRVALRVQREGTPHVESVYRLYRGEDRFEIENGLDRDRMAYVPNDQHSWKYMVTLPFDIHDFSIRSETATRFLDPLSDGFARDGLFDWHNVEHTLAFWDDARGILTASDSISAFHFENLSGLTSPTYSTGDALLLPRMKDKADEYEFDDGTIGPVEQEPDTSPLYPYVHHFRSTDPLFDPPVAAAFGMAALTPLRSRLLSHQAGNMPRDLSSFFEVDAPGVLLATIKPAEDGRGTVLRVVELTGAPAVVGIGSRVLTLVAAERLEQDEEGGVPLAVTGGRVEITLDPYETATVRVETSTSWSPIELSVTKDEAAGVVMLRWTGGVSPYTLERSTTAQFSDPLRLVDEEDVLAYDDPVLDDGGVYFYLVR